MHRNILAMRVCVEASEMLQRHHFTALLLSGETYDLSHASGNGLRHERRHCSNDGSPVYHLTAKAYLSLAPFYSVMTLRLYLKPAVLLFRNGMLACLTHAAPTCLMDGFSRSFRMF